MKKKIKKCGCAKIGCHAGGGSNSGPNGPCGCKCHSLASSLPSKTKSLPSNHLDLEKRIKKIENWIDFWETVRTPWDKNK